MINKKIIRIICEFPAFVMVFTSSDHLLGNILVSRIAYIVLRYTSRTTHDKLTFRMNETKDPGKYETPQVLIIIIANI